MTAADTRSAVAHLARRAGFGLAADEIDARAAGGYAAAVDAVCADLIAPDAAADALERTVDFLRQMLTLQTDHGVSRPVRRP